MLNKNLEQALSDSLKEAQMRNHAYLTLEHLLYAITHNDDGMEILENIGVNLDELRIDITKFLDDMETDPEQSGDPVQTVAFQSILEESLLQVHAAEKKEVDIGDILAAMLNLQDSHARYFLEKQEITRIDVLNYISHGIDDEDDLIADYSYTVHESAEFSENDADTGDVNHKHIKALASFTINMNEMAKNDKYDELIGREKELKRTIEILSRRVKNNPLHVGEPGVGKTSITQGLASRIVNLDIPNRFKGYTVYSLEMGTLLAGTRFRGDFEQRMKTIFNAFEKIGKVIVFIDEIHTVVGAGQVQGSSMDASNMLKPLLANGDIRIIGSTTYDEYRKYFEKDRALSRRFQKIDVREPDVPDTIKILNGLKGRYQEFHKVEYAPSAIRAAADLSNRYIKDRYLPDKAIDVMDEAGANISLYRSNRPRITASDIEKFVGKIVGIPNVSMGANVNGVRDLARILGQSVMGQTHAIAKITSAIRRHRAGLANDEKPVGSFLLVGPTGVGKTELARQIASHLGIELIRFDMSEYMEKHSVARLLGSPPGYVGFDEGALLTDSVRKHPQCVLLLDEIEKAHPDLVNTLLQVMDSARLTDATGRNADFSGALLLMTSNVGSREMSANRIGFNEEGKIEKGDNKSALKNAFAPEFLNRLDAVITFNPLDIETIGKIVEKFINEVNQSLSRKKIVIEPNKEVLNYLATEGVSLEYGARPMKRLIQEKIKDALTDLILEGKLKRNSVVKIGLKNSEFTFSVRSKTGSKKGKVK